MAGSEGQGNEPPLRADDFQIIRLKSSYESFGIVIEYLARIEPFSRYDLGNFAGVIQRQIHEGNHLAAVTRNRIVGYFGWLPTTEKAAAAWQRGEGALVSLGADEVPDAVALTVVATHDKRVLASFIREARKLHPGLRVYFKREQSGGKPARKRVVKNMIGRT